MDQNQPPEHGLEARFESIQQHRYEQDQQCHANDQLIDPIEWIRNADRIAYVCYQYRAAGFLQAVVLVDHNLIRGGHHQGPVLDHREHGSVVEHQAA